MEVRLIIVHSIKHILLQYFCPNGRYEMGELSYMKVKHGVNCKILCAMCCFELCSFAFAFTTKVH